MAHYCAESVDDTCYQRAQDGAGSVFCGVGKLFQGHMLQNCQGQGKRRTIDHRANGHRPADNLVNQECQRKVDQEIHDTDPDTQGVLYHGAQAVDASGGEVVGEDK